MEQIKPVNLKSGQRRKTSSSVIQKSKLVERTVTYHLRLLIYRIWGLFICGVIAFTLNGNLSVQHTTTKKWIRLSKPKEFCEECSWYFYGIKQKQFYGNTKQHLKKVRESGISQWKVKGWLLTSKHDWSTQSYIYFLKRKIGINSGNFFVSNYIQ